MKEKISEHISYEEATASGTAERMGIDNTPTPEQIEAGKNIGTKIFDKVRDHFGCRIAVTSFFRSEAVNKVLEKNPNIVASKKSQHMLFEAMDLNGSVFGGVTNRQIFDWIRENLEFDQLIWEDVEGDQEPEWIHVSLKAQGKNRMEVLRRTRVNGVTKYVKYDSAS
jgi:zinc D-Ala-D-Ala carboxypeptidase